MAKAMARPMPLPPPVIQATLPSNCPKLFFPFQLFIINIQDLVKSRMFSVVPALWLYISQSILQVSSHRERLIVSEPELWELFFILPS
jgi:hypothetical protein